MRPHRWTLIVALIAAVAVAFLAATGGGAPRKPAERLRAPARATPAPAPRRLIVLGRSVDGRRIDAYVLGDRSARRNVLVVGCIHGNEPAGATVVARVAAADAIKGVELWLIPSINPDGEAAGTRQNAHGVDLNRNFPWHWRPLGPPGTQQYAGPRPLSEPESRIAHSLISRLRPAVTIWFHQPLGVVDESGGSIAIERRFAEVAHLPLRRLPRYPGSAASWQDHRLRGTTAFVVELPPGSPTKSEVRRWAAAVGAVAASGRVARSPAPGRR
jgi:murein peptide amidase A